ncbi:hypothetical protein A5780_21430 [Nocardia sp. 852002-20019_SCH5090214]|uniref:nucleotidyl transferase AbiEii/AbiGii toxin family protein n=1 Tax=Nocardia sp. 852002-20019_SCH5090214 TaxID=1834087 RepID=UPI0007EAC982|nr:nucleotidyl transferase AbiEii/AbiGii toxin family protein [Nocardia sp. 852002-20019_SCH5090214]OBA58498.1 hypothetical protein A5780_21430 [Nocardia sp. 852002-20019_SCH5090214]
MRKQYTDRGFQGALNERARKLARKSSRPQSVLLREFFMHRFLARVFAEAGSGWILKGGMSLLVRLPGARSSRDVDLLHRTASFDDAFDELRTLVGRQYPELDPLTFQLDRQGSEDQSGMSVMKLQATPYAGAVPFQGFPIDLTVGRELVGEIDYLAPEHAIDIPGTVARAPEFACYPLADQVADKFAAMYEYRSGYPSTRWRDLVDLLLIINHCTLDAARTLAALHKQVEQRPLLEALPQQVHSPGPRWAESYPPLAKETMLPTALHTLDAALELLGICMNPLLNQGIVEGTWQPSTRSWKSLV